MRKKMILSREYFKNTTEGIKNIAITVAIIVGGIWGYYQFSILSAREESEQRIQKLKNDNFQQPSLDIEIQVDRIIVSHGERNLLGSVIISNVGNKNAMLEFSGQKPPLVVSRVDYDNEQQALHHTLDRSFWFSDYDGISLGVLSRTGRKLKLPFLIPIEGDGTYMVTFDVAASDEDQRVLDHPISIDDIRTLTWQAQEIVSVNGDFQKGVGVGY